MNPDNGWVVACVFLTLWIGIACAVAFVVAAVIGWADEQD